MQRMMGSGQPYVQLNMEGFTTKDEKKYSYWKATKDLCQSRGITFRGKKKDALLKSVWRVLD
jgi:hypothetical protein